MRSAVESPVSVMACGTMLRDMRPPAEPDPRTVPRALAREPDDCLCCHHFAVDFDAMPDAQPLKRPTRQAKRAQPGLPPDDGSVSR